MACALAAPTRVGDTPCEQARDMAAADKHMCSLHVGAATISCCCAVLELLDCWC